VNWALKFSCVASCGSSLYDVAVVWCYDVRVHFEFTCSRVLTWLPLLPLLSVGDAVSQDSGRTSRADDVDALLRRATSPTVAALCRVVVVVVSTSRRRSICDVHSLAIVFARSCLFQHQRQNVQADENVWRRGIMLG